MGGKRKGGEGKGEEKGHPTFENILPPLHQCHQILIASVKNVRVSAVPPCPFLATFSGGRREEIHNLPSPTS